MKRGIAIAAALLALAAAAWLLCPRPALEEYYSHSRAYVDTHGRLLRLTLAADQRYRLFCPLDQISPNLIAATLLYEDKDFYHHPGVDIPALARAFWTTYITRSRRVGASTITMQVARLRWRIRTNTIAGKLRQILRALQLTRHYPKARILEAYLNLAPYGGNIEGIQAASLIYFNKSADRLTVPEALSLAVVPQNPVQRNPARPKGFDHLQAARKHLFARWIETHPRDRQLTAFFDRPLAVRSPAGLPFAAPHLIDYLEATTSGSTNGRVPTTLDLDRQLTMQAVISSYVARRAAEGITNAAALALDTRSMTLTALAGSADFFNPRIQGQVNGATARRSPGSALKPFVYALAMDQGLVHPMSLMKDSPRRYGGFTPENFDQRFLGPVSAHDALILSRNLPAANLQARLGEPGFYALLQRAGISELRPAAHYGLALCLGGVEVTMLELAGLYAALANGGRLQPIRMVKGEMAAPSGIRILSPEASFLTLDILKDNPPPSSHRQPLATIQGNEVAWKTGTSHGFRDAWAIGVSRDMVIAVWVGNFNGKGNRAFVGRSAAGPLLFDLLAALVPERGWRVADTMNFSQLNLKQIEVCATTGELPGRHCPHTKKSWFIPGISPIRVCTVHRAVPIDRATGLRACRYEPGHTPLAVFEFWPSDLLAVFRMAGVSLKTPPPFGKACDLDRRAGAGQPPVVTSPQAELVYALQSDRATHRQIPFTAVADGDVRRLYWFVDNSYVGNSASQQPLMWTARSGKFDVRVVDDHGRAGHTTVSVQMVR
ncbi:penicillin-binding protein 1C [Desulfosarcina ovata subsp. sediminis]|uniref:peptidoglycan glycosyltransferase n=1 Tax=Desulfosarcina ovata subsp. sediminis TaxID=885957 RepID=A0A5K7ZUH8_9BACT|nr:penicillin-binding protein 1C [Desulfosarcina ovata]BBO83858.1 penicillin-binding protein 1C [Desulfosarcina ovata subsp. sediminis]